MDNAAERLATIKTRIAKAQQRFGSPPDAVELVAVSKTFSAEEIRPFLAAGQRVQDHCVRFQPAVPVQREGIPEEAVPVAQIGDRVHVDDVEVLEALLEVLREIDADRAGIGQLADFLA